MKLKGLSIPPYSPEINPAEKIIKAIKLKIIKQKAEGEQDLD